MYTHVYRYIYVYVHIYILLYTEFVIHVYTVRDSCSSCVTWIHTKPDTSHGVTDVYMFRDSCIHRSWLMYIVCDSNTHRTGPRRSIRQQHHDQKLSIYRRAQKGKMSPNVSSLLNFSGYTYIHIHIYVYILHANRAVRNTDGAGLEECFWYMFKYLNIYIHAFMYTCIWIYVHVYVCMKFFNQ